MAAFSTIASPFFSELVIFRYRERHLGFSGVMFGTLRAMAKVRPFKLVLLLQVPHPPKIEERQVFERTVESAVAQGLFNFLSSPPTTRVEGPEY